MGDISIVHRNETEIKVRLNKEETNDAILQYIQNKCEVPSGKWIDKHITINQNEVLVEIRICHLPINEPA